MRGRREAVALVGASLAVPIAVFAQAPSRRPTIGFLGGQSASAMRDWVATFSRRLAELGWIEGHNITIEYRWAEGRKERAAEFAAEFVSMKVDLIVTAGTANVVAAKDGTGVIPIVFAAAGDPVANGLVASLARPGGNVTGLSNSQPILRANRSSSYASSSPACGGWRSLPTWAVQLACSTCARFRPLRVRSALLSYRSRSGGPRTSRPHSSPWMVARMRSLSPPTRS